MSDPDEVGFAHPAELRLRIAEIDTAIRQNLSEIDSIIGWNQPPIPSKRAAIPPERATAPPELAEIPPQHRSNLVTLAEAAFRYFPGKTARAARRGLGKKMKSGELRFWKANRQSYVFDCSQIEGLERSKEAQRQFDLANKTNAVD